MAIQLRYDEVPWDEFHPILHRQISNSSQRTLIPESKLRDFKILTRRNKQGLAELDADPKRNRDFTFYFIREEDLVLRSLNRYILICTDTDGAEDLVKIVQRFRMDLRSKGTDTLLRIDPRHGAVVGSTVEAVSRFGARERPFCFMTLVCTRDPGHPLVAVHDYADREDRQGFQEMFEKFNHVPSWNPSILKKMFVSSPATEAPATWAYQMISEVASVLLSRYQMFLRRISLIYENVTENELEACAIDRKYSIQAAGVSRFFTSTEELLQ